MREYLNKAENIEKGFLSIDKRIKQIEEAIGYDKIKELSQDIADYLFHMQVDEPSLNSIISSREKQSQIAICILNASCEIESAYHLLTTGNVPAIYRQCRLIHEFSAVAIFLSIPKKDLLEYLSEKNNLIKKINDNPNSDFWDLYKSSYKKMGSKFQRVDPIIKGNILLPPYLEFLRKCLPLSPKDTTWLSTQVKHVLHPISHGSIEMLPFHFGTVKEDGKGGINYSSNKIEMYQGGIEYIIWTTKFLSKVFELTRSFIIKNN
ncbi:hypothetical protein [Gracilimonas sediminicola]|uniref:Uncharacterized protein n=1 Tax=Gracilimonas sediminicola TaxID=2952158 RepID=A0A9X2RG64_9BACT|nr:hypothetical protein [Gracilimonas sediminicola]MCP9293005.1 hypothetical protein [Gracilimonas sediminicola]